MTDGAHLSSRDHNSIASSVFVGVGGLIIIAVIGALATHALVVHFGPTDYGIVTLAMSAAATVQGLSEFGQTQLLQREIARAPEREGELLSDSLSLRLTATAVICLIAGSLLIGIYGRHSGRTTWALVMTLAAVPLAAASQSLGAHFYHQLKNLRLVTSQVLQQVLYVVVVVVVVTRNLSVPWAAASSLLSITPLFVVLVTMVNREVPVRYSIRLHRWRETLVAAAPLGTSALLGAFYLKADVLILGVEGTYHQLGQYGVAIAINSFFFTVPTQLTRIFMPVISRSGERWLSAGQDLVHWAWLAGVSSFLSLLVGAPYVVHVFAGPRFHEAIAPLRILGGSVPAIALSSALTALCVARGYAKMLGAISASMLALNVIANIVVIPRFGIVGSAWATTACEYLGLALVALHFAHRSSIAVGKLHRVAGIALAVVISLGCAYLIRGWSLSLTHFAVGQLGVMGIFVIAVTVTGYLPRTLVMWMIGGRHHQPMWWHRVIDPRGFYRRSQA